MIEKILERLEEEETKWNDVYELDRDRGARNYYAAARKRTFTEAIQIVQEVAKEYEVKTATISVDIGDLVDSVEYGVKAPYQKGE